MLTLGFSNTELKAIFAVLAAIIHLGHTKIVKKGNDITKRNVFIYYLLIYIVYYVFI